MRPRPYRRVIPRTEERVFPAARRQADQMLAEHWQRYRYIAESGEGRILDLGCGTGYGARELALGDAVTEVVAIDRSAEALGLAKRYYDHPCIRYRPVDVTRPGWGADLGRFDSVVALEVLEHLPDETAFWTEIGRILLEGGTLWLSTPLGRGRGRPAADPYHVHQLRRSEVVSLFKDRWSARYYGQSGCLIEPWVAGRRYYTILARGQLR